MPALRNCACRDKLRPYINTTGQIRNETFRQLVAEFFGTLLFQMFGGSAPAKDTTAPAANGFALVALSESLDGSAALVTIACTLFCLQAL
jgi:aquaporin TIP